MLRERVPICRFLRAAILDLARSFFAFCAILYRVIRTGECGSCEDGGCSRVLAAILQCAFDD